MTVLVPALTVMVGESVSPRTVIATFDHVPEKPVKSTKPVLFDALNVTMSEPAVMSISTVVAKVEKIRVPVDPE